MSTRNLKKENKFILSEKEKNEVDSIILAIKPEYIEKIASGEKTFELRKIIPKFEPKKIIVYASSPLSKVVGVIEVKKMHVGTPKKIWALTKKR